MRKVIVVSILGAASMYSMAQSPPSAETYPSRPIRFVVTFAAGSASDNLARQLGQKMAERWGQPVIVENRPSASGVVAGEIVTRATPDGYTLMFASSAIASSAALNPQLPYDTLRDFTPISLIATAPLVVVTSPQKGIKTLKDLIALARQQPGKLSYGNSGIGSGNHYAAELLNAVVGIKTVGVPYKSASAGMNDVASQRIDYAFTAIAAAVPVVHSGRVVAVAVTTADRSHILPDVPTVMESGVSGYKYMGWFGMFGPGKLSPLLVSRLSAEIARILVLPDVRERMLNLATSPSASTPEVLRELIRSEIQMRQNLFGREGLRSH